MYPSRTSFGANQRSYHVELYPRRRPTEFYTSPQPQVEHQSRNYEHPADKLPYLSQSKSAVEPQQAVHEGRIAPPRSSDMRVARNSYFS